MASGTLQTRKRLVAQLIVSDRCPEACRLQSVVNMLTKTIERRQLMKEEKITQEEALEVRRALTLPGGLELHIGVSSHIHEADNYDARP